MKESPQRQQKEEEIFENDPEGPPLYKFGPFATELLKQVKPLPDKIDQAFYYEDGTINEKAILLAKSMPTKAELIAESEKLTELYGRPTLPPSMLMDMLQWRKQHLEDDYDYEADVPGCPGASIDCGDGPTTSTTTVAAQTTETTTVAPCEVPCI